MSIKSSFALLALLVLGSSCVARYSKHGYVPAPEQISKINIGSTNKELLTPLIGAPAFITKNNNKEHWYYASSQKKSVAFLKEKITENNITKLDISNGVVIAISYYDLNDMKNIKFNEDSTDNAKADLGIIKQLLGNAGRFSNSDDF